MRIMTSNEKLEGLSTGVKRQPKVKKIYVIVTKGGEKSRKVLKRYS